MADGAEVRFSHRLAVLHGAGVGLLIAVALASVLWISARHNELARSAAQDMVAASISALQTKLRTFARDYSIWDEAYEAALTDDVDWLYSNIGTAAAEIGALDLIVIVVDGRQRRAWRAGSGREGEGGLLDPALAEALLGLLGAAGTAAGDIAHTAAAFARHDGRVWAFAVSRITPVDGLPAGTPEDAAPRQIHGVLMDEDRMAALGEGLLPQAVSLADAPPSDRDSLALLDAAGGPVAYVVWTAPKPGARILRQVAIPLLLALAAAAAAAVATSRFAVRSARRLEEALVAARRADAAKTEFMSNVSHELRTPMNGILGVLQLMERTELQPAQRRMLGVLRSSAETQMALIGDLLDALQLESGARRLVAEPLRPAEVAQEVVDLLAPEARRKGLSLALEIDAASAGASVLGDARALKQILTNLIGNAVKFTDEGGVRVRLSVTREDQAARVECAVVDTGPGIAPEHQAVVFDRFGQVDATLTRRADGLGLGLSISLALARLMGGGIALRSEPGQGATFTFSARLPVEGAIRERTPQPV